MRPALAALVGSLVGAAAFALGQELPRPRTWKLSAIERKALDGLAARRAELDALEAAHNADVSAVLQAIGTRLELPPGDLRRLDAETITVVPREPAAVAAPSSNSPASGP